MYKINFKNKKKFDTQKNMSLKFKKEFIYYYLNKLY